MASHGEETRSESGARLHPATICVHGAPVAESGRSKRGGKPVVEPMIRSTVFHLDDEAYEARRDGRADVGRVYARETNPTIESVERRLAALEGTERALVFASGMAAFHAVLMATLSSGDNVVAVRQLYGGTFALMRELLPRLGVELRIVAFDSEEEWRGAIDDRTRIFNCESISNPLAAVADLPAIARILRECSQNGLLVVDATLASPVGQRPIELGADIVFHSATKYLGGHSDLTGGVVAANTDRLRDVWNWRTSAGGCMDPEGAFLLARGLRTLALRVRAQTQTAVAVARFLDAHSKVAAVHYCGLEGDPSYAAAQRLLEETGGVLGFVVAGGDDAALRVIRRLRLIAEAASLGGVESLVSRPIDLSHAYLDEEERARAGIVPGLVRLAVGVEDARDLIADLGRALDSEQHPLHSKQ